MNGCRVLTNHITSVIIGVPIGTPAVLWWYFSVMATLISEKPVRKPRNIKIDPEAVHRARVEALRSKKSLREWLEEAVEEKAAGGRITKIKKTCSHTGLF